MLDKYYYRKRSRHMRKLTLIVLLAVFFNPTLVCCESIRDNFNEGIEILFFKIPEGVIYYKRIMSFGTRSF
jgi:hypothetical protein